MGDRRAGTNVGRQMWGDKRVPPRASRLEKEQENAQEALGSHSRAVPGKPSHQPSDKDSDKPVPERWLSPGHRAGAAAREFQREFQREFAAGIRSPGQDRGGQGGQGSHPSSRSPSGDNPRLPRVTISDSHAAPGWEQGRGHATSQRPPQAQGGTRCRQGSAGPAVSLSPTGGTAPRDFPCQAHNSRCQQRSHEAATCRPQGSGPVPKPAVTPLAAYPRPHAGDTTGGEATRALSHPWLCHSSSSSSCQADGWQQGQGHRKTQGKGRKR